MLSMIKHSTSLRLPVIKLDFVRPPATKQSLAESAGDDLQWVAEEVARIEREFEGVANLTVLRDTPFQVVLDALNVRLLL